MGFYRKTLHNVGPMDINVISSAADARPRKINLVNCLPDNIYAEPGQSTPESAKNAIMNAEGFSNTGHTEFLQKEFGVDDVTMIMVSDQIRIGVVTGHIPLRDVPGSISKEAILGKLRIMKASLERDFGVTDPKIAVLGLNPHCGDGGLLGDEEQNIILPAVKAAQEEGIQAFGPYSPDGFFGLGRPLAPTPPTDSSAWAITAVSMPPWPCTTTKAWLPSRPLPLPMASTTPPACPWCAPHRTTAPPTRWPGGTKPTRVP